MQLEANDFDGNEAFEIGNNIFWTNRDDSILIPPEGCKTVELDNFLCILWPAEKLRFNLRDTTYIKFIDSTEFSVV